MQGTITTHESSFEKVVFESVIDTFAGGVTLDPTGLSDIFTDGIVPAGTLVGKKDATTGLSKVVTVTPGSPDTYDVVPLGFTHATVKIDANPIVGVVIEGVVRKDALSTAYKNAVADIEAENVLPKITFV